MFGNKGYILRGPLFRRLPSIYSKGHYGQLETTIRWDTDNQGSNKALIPVKVGNILRGKQLSAFQERPIHWATEVTVQIQSATAPNSQSNNFINCSSHLTK